MTTQSEAKAAQDKADRREGKSPGRIEMEDLGKTSRNPDAIKADAERVRDHGFPRQTQQIPVVPSLITQDELEAREEEKRAQNRKAQEPA
jgi:hypothetical protein